MVVRARSFAWAVVAVAVLAGGAMRFGSAAWGLPYLFHPDEKGFVIWEAMSTEWRGLVHDDWRPRTNTYGPLIYEVAIGVKWWLYGGPAAAEPVARSHDTDWDYVRLAFGFTDEARWRWPELARVYRAIAAGMGTLAVWLLALAAGRLAGARAAAWTAVLAATSVGLVQAAHFYTTEAFLMLELAMLAHAAALLATGGGLGAAAYAGVALGLIGGTKLTGLAAAPALVLAIAAGRGARVEVEGWARALGSRVVHAVRALVDRRFLVAALVAAALLFAINPWLFLDPDAYFNDVPLNRSGLWHVKVQLVETGFGFYDWRFTYYDTPRWWFHLTTLLPYALSGPAVALALVALGRGVRRLDALGLVALAFAVPPVVLVGGWMVKALRYVLPAVPGLVLALGGLAAAWGHPRADGADARARALAWARAAAVWLAVGWTALYGVAFFTMFLEPDSRVAAARWLAAHAEPGDVVVLEPESSYTAPLGDDRGMTGVEPGLRVPVRARYLWESLPPQDRVEAHLEQTLRGARFLVLGDFYIRRAMHPEALVRAPAQRRFYERVRSGEGEWRRVATFRRVPRLGPFVFPEDDAEILSTSFDHTGLEIYERR